MDGKNKAFCCYAEPCVVSDKSKEREKRIISCNSPGCQKQFHVTCVGHSKTTDREMQNIFFVCTTCESYINYSAEIARKSIMNELDIKLDKLKHSIYQSIDEKIQVESAKILEQTQSLYNTWSENIMEKLNEVRNQATDANDLAINFMKESNQKITENQNNLNALNERVDNEITDFNASLRSIQNQVALLDSKRRKKTFLIKNFPETACSVNGKYISSCQEAASAVAQVLGLQNEVGSFKDVHRLGKARENGRPRLIAVKTSERIVKLFLSKARSLKNANHPLNTVFIQEDLPPEMNRKLAEMRKRAYEYRRDNPGEEAFVKSKKLFINGIVVDEAKSNF